MTVEAELPDGTVLEFPDGTDRAVIQRAVKARLARGGASAPAPTAQAVEQPSEPFQRAGGHGAFTAGLADAGIKTAIGLDQLNSLNPGHILANVLRGKHPLQGDLDNAQGVLAAMKDEEKYDPNKKTRMAGEITGNVLENLIPGSKLAKVLPGKQILNSALTSGITGLVTDAGEGSTPVDALLNKGKQAAIDTAAGGAVGGIGRILSKVFRGANLKPEAQLLMDQGVQPTLQQGASNPITRFIGGLTSGMTDVRGRQEKELLDALTKQASGGKASLAGGTLNERVAMLDDLLGKEYQGVLSGKRFPISPSVQQEVMDQGSNVATRTGQFTREATEALGDIGNIMGNPSSNRNVNSDTLIRNYLLPLAREASMKDNPRVQQALMSARDVLINKVRNTRLSPDELALLREIDSRYFDVSRLREVAKGAAGEGEGVSIGRLTTAYSNAPESAAGNQTLQNLIGPAERVLGYTPTQDKSRTAFITLKRTLPALAAGYAAAGGAPGLAAVAAPIYGMSALGQTKQGAKILFGGTDTQKALAELMRRAEPYMAPLGADVYTGDQ